MEQIKRPVELKHLSVVHIEQMLKTKKKKKEY